MQGMIQRSFRCPVFGRRRPGRGAWFWLAFFFWSQASGALFAAPDPETCERARELMQESGIARDAKEDFFGRLKIKPPRTSFPPEMDRVTWWGRFKAFEFWQSPEFDAVWVNPEGQAVERQQFRGGRCELAKATLSTATLPRERLSPGMWRVVVSCGQTVIDNHPFAVVGSSGPGPDGVMIWAEGVKE